MDTERMGIIDLGSNSARLVIYEVQDNGAFRPCFRLKQNIRLAQYIDSQTGDLQPEGLARSVACIQLFHRMGQLYQVVHWRCVATAAVRQASNQAVFMKTLEDATGLQFEILSGGEEAYYGFLGAMNTMSLDEAVLFDIGGASTEVMYVSGHQLRESISLPFGAFNLAKRFHDLPADQQSVAVMAFMGKAFDNLSWLKDAKGVSLIGIGGTARALAKADGHMKGADVERIHGHELRRTDVNHILQRMIESSPTARRKLGNHSKARADIIVAGLSTIQALTDRVLPPELIISGNGLREGLFYEHYFRHAQTPLIADVLHYSLDNFLKLYQVNVEMVYLLRTSTLRLFDALQPVHELGSYERKLIDIATQVESCGNYINTEKYAKHTTYLIAFSHLYGLRQAQLNDLSKLILDRGDKALRQLRLLIRLAKLLCLQAGIEPEHITCELKPGAVLVGSAPSLQETARYGSDADMEGEFERLFHRKLKFIESAEGCIS